MDWQPFRDNLLWTLDVDDLFKANLATISKVYTKYTRDINPKIKFLTKDNLILMIEDCGAPLNDKQVTMAYALSKYTIQNEMGDFDNYNKMTLGEFYECIGRLAALLYKEN